MRLKFNSGFTLIELIYVMILLFFVLGVIPWGVNIYKLTQCDFQEPYKEEILRGIGIPVYPMGIIMAFKKVPESELSKTPDTSFNIEKPKPQKRKASKQKNRYVYYDLKDY